MPIFYPKSFHVLCIHCFCILTLCHIIYAEKNNSDEFSNEWAVEIIGGYDAANRVAQKLGFINHGKILNDENFYLFSHPRLRKRALGRNQYHHSNLVSHPSVDWAEQQRIKRRVKRDAYDPSNPPNDPRWNRMWYLHENIHPNMKVKEAWAAGFSGKNVSVTILDDGIEPKHPDLQANYDPLASGDINDHDDDPTPRLNPSNENRHGTRCAGEVSAVANNGICSVGIAYNSKIGGVRMLDGQVTDAVEASSIGFHPEHVDIYSASWGPDDDGRTVDGPAKLARKAFVNGVTKGRDGKGSIFVWASGNGGRYEDNCNCDGYTDSIYTLSISSATQRKTKPWYSESCSSTLASTYSSGSSMDMQIVTTDLRHGCTDSHTGTSASAPLAAAICALALEANPNLTWRDMQHLVVQTANPDGLVSDDWSLNGVNRKVSHAFGYGLMDAHAMVIKAQNWTLVPPQRHCTISVISEDHSPRVFHSDAPVTIPFEVSGCDNGAFLVDRLEHVQAELTIRNNRRGDLEIYLVSALGTRSQLLGFRRPDASSSGFVRWSFMTTHCWDEDPKGRWRLEVHDRNGKNDAGTISLFNLILYGTRHTDWPSQYQPDVFMPLKEAAPTDAVKHIPSSKKTPTTTSKSALENVNPLFSNCQIPLKSNQGCLVCNSPYILDAATNLCVTTCPSGHYRSLERVNGESGMKITAPREMSSEYRFEFEEEETFEEEERFFDSWKCLPCAKFCHKCTGPLGNDCVQCVIGAEFWFNRTVCFPKNSNISAHETRPVIYIMLCVVIIGALVLLFFLCRSYKSNSIFKSSISYKHLPTGEGAVEYHDEEPYSDEAKVNQTLHASHYFLDNMTSTPLVSAAEEMRKVDFKDYDIEEKI